MLLLLLLSRLSCPTLCDPIDGSPPGSSVPGILQARTLEWVAISFSNAWKWKVKVKSLGRVRLFATPWTAAYQSPPSMGFSGQEYWSGVPLPSPLSLLFFIYSWKCVFGRFFPNGVVWRHLVVVVQYSISLLVNQIPLLSTVRQERQDCSVASSSLKTASIASIMRICSPKIKHITSYDKLPFVKHKIFHFYELNF